MAVAELPTPGPGDPVDALLTAAETVVGRDVDALDDRSLERELEVLEQVRRRAEARQCRVADTLRERRANRLRDRGTEPEKAERRAERATRQQLKDQLQWSASDANRATRLGRELARTPRVAGRFAAGQLPPRHAQLLADTLRHLIGDERDRAETQLLQAAQAEDAVTFGRSCRRLLAELDHEAAMADECRRHGRRAARMAQTDDGMLAISAQLSGADAETVATAIHAFRRPDPPDVHRRPEQATADALADMAAAALRAGDAPTTHGIRPHVTVDVDYATQLAQAGVAETVWMGPLPFGEIRRLLADCGVSRLLIGPDATPVEAGPETRTVPNGLYRGLLRRDRGCIGAGCDAPAAWCDAMHLDHPYRFQGRLSLHNAALGCKLHHRKYDLEGWQITWHHGRPTLHPPGRPPGKETRAPGSDPPEHSERAGPGSSPGVAESRDDHGPGSSPGVAGDGDDHSGQLFSLPLDSEGGDDPPE